MLILRPLVLVVIGAASALAQVRWTQRILAQSPPARSGHAMAYDSARDRVVLFGGIGPMLALADTWEWDGTSWSQRFPAQSPPARFDHAMAYDPVRRRTVLFGGMGSTGIRFEDTWEWDGTSWLSFNLIDWPSRRSFPAMAFHAATQRIVLFGGAGVAGVMLSDTWEWNGTTWSRRTPATVPPVRGGGFLAADATRGALVLFGGASTYSLLNDTWLWDGTNWRQAFPRLPLPAARVQGGMARHTGPDRVVLFGGSSGTSLGDTWEWNGLEWLPAPTAIAPSARFGTPLVSRGASRSLLLFGGQGVHQGPLLGDTWEMDYAGCVPGGVGSPGGGLACGCSTEPRIGTTFCVSFSHPPPQGAGWGLLLLAPGPCLATPFPIAPPGVCVQTLVRLAPALIVPGAGDPLRFCIALPAHPALLGQQLCLQGAALDVGVCLRATDAVQAVVYR